MSGKEPLWTSNFVRIWIINLGLCIWGFMLNAPFPFYILELGGNELIVGLTAGGFAIASLIMRPLAGWILDKKSRSWITIWGIALLILISLLLMLVPILGVAVFLRIISGPVLSGAHTASATNACDTIPQNRFGEGIGYLGLGNSLATALGPALGLAIIAGLGFRELFTVSIAVLVLAALIVRGFKFKKIERTGSPEGRERIKLTSLFNADALPASVVMLFASAPFGAVSVFIALYGEQYNLGHGAVFFILVAVGTGSMRLLSGRLADKKGERPMVAAGNSSFFLALVLLLFNSGACYYISGLLFGIGFGVTIPALNAMAMRIIPPEKRGSAASTFHGAYDVSSGLGGLIAGVLVTYWGYRPMFGTFCVFVVISSLVYQLWASKKPSAFEAYQRSRSEDMGESE